MVNLILILLRAKWYVQKGIPVTDSFMPHDVVAITRLVLKTRASKSINTERRTVLITNKIYKYWLHEKKSFYFLVVLPHNKFILVSLPADYNKFRAIVACWCLRSNQKYFFSVSRGWKFWLSDFKGLTAVQ